MSRIRTVKPDLFLDEDLGVLSGDHALLFIGLWTIADREGRFEWRPARIKATLFPYRAADVDSLLADLCAIGKLRRYEASGIEIGDIPGFVKHQRPHPKEPKSTLPSCSNEAEPCLSTASRVFPRQASKPAGKHPECKAGRPVGREGKEIWEGDLDLPSAAVAQSAPQQPLALEVQKPKRERKPSRAESVAAELLARRREVMPRAPDDAPVKQPMLNQRLGAVLDAVGEQGTKRAWESWLTDEWGRSLAPPCALHAFLSEAVWRKHAALAEQREAKSAEEGQRFRRLKPGEDLYADPLEAQA